MINSDLEEILQVVADATKTSIKAFADGYQFNDLFSFVPVFAEIPAAIGIFYFFNHNLVIKQFWRIRHSVPY